MRVVLVLAFLFSARVHSLRPFHLRDPVTFAPRESVPSNYREGAGTRSLGGYDYHEEFLDGVPIDHFSYADNRTIGLRFFLNVKHFQCGKPIFFYTGNEGKLEGFAENTGFMWDAAPEFQAAIVFAEHRFYGKTQPFGNESYATVANLGYLSSEQALADFAYLIEHLKARRIRCSEHSPVIAFGGSYGGMLAAWMRVKYPHIIQGAIAASAPVFWFFDSGVAENAYDLITSRTFGSSGCDLKAFAKAWTALENLAKTDSGRAYLNKLFKLESKSKLRTAEDFGFLRDFIKDIMESLVMVDYPYPTSFLAPLPGWPVKKACAFFSSPATSDEEAALSLFQLANLYYNYSGQAATLCANARVCDNAFAALGDPLGWPWQSCTEMVMPLCSNGAPTDVFWRTCPFTVKDATAGCSELFGKIGFSPELLRPRAVTRNYGATAFPSASNIVFSNGFLDPWSGGGWSKENKVAGSLVSVILQQGAHHYDLRGEHPDDTEEVKKVRQLEKKHIRTWIKEFSSA